MLSPAAAKLMGNTTLYPLPQTTTITTPNYTYASASYINIRPGRRQAATGGPTTRTISVSATPTDARTTRASTPSRLFYNSFNKSPFQNEVINWTRTFSPSLVNEARIGVNNVMLDNGGADKGLGNIALNAGIANAGPGLLSLQGFTYMSGIGNANIGTQQLFANTTFHYADNLTIIRGRHMMKMGGQVLREWINVFYAGNNGRTGYIAFNGRFTAQNALNPTPTIGEADFMLGLPDDLGRGLQSGTWGQRVHHLGLLLPGRLARHQQPDFEPRACAGNITPRGWKWKTGRPTSACFRDSWNWLRRCPRAWPPRPDRRRSSKATARLYNAYKKDFQPRIGFAYTPDMLSKKLVFRGAYTISSYLEGTGTNLRLPLNPPFEQEFEDNYNIAGAQYALPGSTLDQGLSLLNPKNPYAGATIRLWDPFVRPAEVQQWNAHRRI